MNRFAVGTLDSRLFGRIRGKHDAPAWERNTPAEIAEATPWMVDFAGVDATYSYLDETIGKILTRCAEGEFPDVYPILSNLNDDTLEELKGSLQLRNLAVWTKKGKDWRIAGVLDVSLKEALLEVIANEGKGSKDLKAKSEISQAGWANRLSGLVRMRLITRNRAGKTFQYGATPRLIEPATELVTDNNLFLRSAYGVSRPGK